MSFNILEQVESSLAVKRVGIQEFAESTEYCDKPLYPRQLVLLKLIFLEEMEGWEEDVLTYWLNGARGGEEIEISSDIRERRDWLRENGYKHFREVVLVGGRRSSKGYITGIAMAKVMFDTLQLQDPGRYYGVDPTKNIMFSCIAGSEEQAKEYQFADLSSVIDSCKAFDRYVVKSLETEIRVATETDLRLAMQAKARGNKTQKDIARLRGKALASNAGTIRGSATMAVCIDEMAHMLEGISKASASTVYDAIEPSLAQFRAAAIMFCNSSPYTEVGKFHERYKAGLEQINEGGNPRVLTFRFPSWALFEGYQGYKSTVTGRGFPFAVTASADWDPKEKNPDGTDYWSHEDKQAIGLEKASEQTKPDVYKVEKRSQFAVVTDAFLNPAMVERMYEGVPVGYTPPPETSPIFEPISSNWGEGVRNFHRYKGHLDPSSTTAGFGFAIGHLEMFVNPDGVEEPHVVFDIIKRWKPQDFKGGAIHWDTVMKEVMVYVELFRPYELTLDQYNSAEPIQKLNKELRDRGLEGIRIFEKTATPEVNWKRADVYKTALYQNLVHAPNDTVDTAYSMLELKFLQEHRMNSKYSRIARPSVGEVKTKDMADCYDDQTEVLTENGWKLFKDVGDERVATRSVTGELEYQLPINHIERDATSLLVYEGTRLNFAVTPKHRMLVTNSRGRESFVLAEDLSNGYYKVPKTSRFTTTIAPPKYGDETPDDFARFVGFWLADGRKCKGYDGHHGIRISQTKSDGIAWVDSLMSRLGWHHRRWVQGTGEVVWHVTSKALREYLSNLQEGVELRLPSDCYVWSEGREGLLEGLLVGDGVWSAQQQRYTGFWNTSEKLVDDVQRLLIHNGSNGRKRLNRLAGTLVNMYRGKQIISTKDLWYLHIDLKSDAKLFPRRIVEQDYAGKVYCLTVPNGTLMVRRNGVAMWCGNCIMEVTHSLIGNLIADRVQQGIAQHMLIPGAQGGYRIGGDTMADRSRATPDQMKAALTQRKGEQSMRGQRDGRRSGMSIGRRRSRGW